MSEYLKIVFEHIPVEEKLYDSYEEFSDSKLKEKQMRQIIILQNRMKIAQNTLKEFIEIDEKALESTECKHDSKRRKI